MKKIVKFGAMMFGALAIMGGTTSCEKETHECCTFTYDSDTYTYCEDDSNIGTDATDEYTWSEITTYVALFGGSCEDVDI